MCACWKIYKVSGKSKHKNKNLKIQSKIKRACDTRNVRCSLISIDWTPLRAWCWDFQIIGHFPPLRCWIRVHCYEAVYWIRTRSAIQASNDGYPMRGPCLYLRRQPVRPIQHHHSWVYSEEEDPIHCLPLHTWRCSEGWMANGLRQHASQSSRFVD